MKLIFSLFISVLLSVTLSAQRKKPNDKSVATPAVAVLPVSDTLKSDVFAGLTLRSIGPALVSGRVVDIAVNPKKHSEYYVAVASGGVWKTINAGTT